MIATGGFCVAKDGGRELNTFLTISPSVKNHRFLTAPSSEGAFWHSAQDVRRSGCPPHPSKPTVLPSVSLRLGHARVLTVHRTVIHYARAASLPIKGKAYGGISPQSRCARQLPLQQGEPFAGDREAFCERGGFCT